MTASFQTLFFSTLKLFPPPNEAQAAGGLSRGRSIRCHMGGNRRSFLPPPAASQGRELVWAGPVLSCFPPVLCYLCTVTQAPLLFHQVSEKQSVTTSHGVSAPGLKNTVPLPCSRNLKTLLVDAVQLPHRGAVRCFIGFDFIDFPVIIAVNTSVQTVMVSC